MYKTMYILIIFKKYVKIPTTVKGSKCRLNLTKTTDHKVPT